MAATSESLSTEDTQLYLDIPQGNPHFGASRLRANGDFRPGRKELYGHKPYDVLTRFGAEPDGTLAVALSYAEPLALFGHVLER